MKKDSKTQKMKEKFRVSGIGSLRLGDTHSMSPSMSPCSDRDIFLSSDSYLTDLSFFLHFLPIISLCKDSFATTRERKKHVKNMESELK